MKANLSISSSYGFDHNWTLTLTTKKATKSFYLGQDVKFCTRVLGMEPRDVVNESGVRDLRYEKNRTKLAKYICRKLNLNGKNMKKIEVWELCAQ